MKKIITAAALAATVGVASANTMMNAMYAGVSGGYGMGSYKVKGTAGENALRGFNGGVHVGYMQDMGMVVCGLEANGDLHGMGYKAGHTKFNAKNSFGLSARFGKMCGGWMTCLRLGWMNTKFESKKLIGTEHKKDNNRMNGFVAGLSFETPVMGNMMVGAEYTHTMYGAKKFKKTLNDKKVTPRVSHVGVRLSYKF